MIRNDSPKSTLIHDYKVPFPGIRKKVVWHFSDIHLSEYDALSTEEEILRAKEASEGWIFININSHKIISTTCTCLTLV